MKTHHSFNAKTRGFTLIEMLVTITIIVILAGLSLSGFKYVTAKQASEQAKIQTQLLSKALEEYKLDNGNYPVTGNTATGNSNLLYQELYLNGTGANPTGKIYLAELDPDNNKQGWTQAAGQVMTLIDPWQNEYYYLSAKTATGTANSNAINPDFDLYSAGPDGRTAQVPTDPAVKDDINHF